ncbi:hypothetical protein, partial [Brevibacillus agri]|uniref:hypothetical protein n=1 Tax=Brevibacillus agri TaxID=51101 RepID=UPI003D232D6A
SFQRAFFSSAKLAGTLGYHNLPFESTAFSSNFLGVFLLSVSTAELYDNTFIIRESTLKFSKTSVNSMVGKTGF